MSPVLSADMKKAIEILSRNGATEVYLFGSHARGDATPSSDVDFAVRGMPPEHFYRAVGEACSAVSVPVDIVDLDETGPALDCLKQHGDFLRVA